MKGKLFVRNLADQSHAQEIKRAERSSGEFCIYFFRTLADLRGGNCTYSIEITRSVTVKESHNFIHTGAERNVGLASESCCPDLILNYPS